MTASRLHLVLIFGLHLCICWAAAANTDVNFGIVASQQSQPEFLQNNDTSDNNGEEDILERGKDLVDEALIPVYDMTNFFLEDVVQPNDLNYMAERGVDFSDLDAVLDSFEDDYETWAEYAIGIVTIFSFKCKKTKAPTFLCAVQGKRSSFWVGFLDRLNVRSPLFPVSVSLCLVSLCLPFSTSFTLSISLSKISLFLCVYDSRHCFPENIVHVLRRLQNSVISYLLGHSSLPSSQHDQAFSGATPGVSFWMSAHRTRIAGYSVCAVIGVLLLVVVPLVGFIVCCCRTCCGACGGAFRPTATPRCR